MTANSPQTIIIDEPQSFLHPGAVRKLFDIFNQEYPQHQYIISTHSPIALTSSDPQTVLLIRKTDMISEIKPIDINDLDQARMTLAEVGARLSDVFGAENILWVEGATEEKCFPLILSRVAKKPLLGTVILGVLNTGDFDGKHSQVVLNIYTRLSEGRGLMPPALGFIFDRERRSEEAIRDLERQSTHQGKTRVWFLERLLYENYLLNPEAIAAVISRIKGFRDRRVTPQEIDDLLKSDEYRGKKYIAKASKRDEETDDYWIKNVHGAKVLDDLFIKLSESRFRYDKVTHGTALTQWIVANVPDELNEIADLLKNAIVSSPSN